MFTNFLISAFVILLVSLIIAIFVVWFKKPSWALQVIIWLSIRRCGLRVHYIRGQKLVYCYGERGTASADQSTLVFVHGFSAGKDSWLGTIQNLPRNVHVVAVDLPGHGGTSVPRPDEPVCLQQMVDGLRELIVLAKLNERPIHLIGTSMGGTVSGMYAAQYPLEVDRLTLVCPCVKPPVLSRYMMEYKSGVNRLLPATVGEIKEMLSVYVYHKEKVPQNHQILKALLQLQRNKATFLEQLFNTVASATKEELEKHLCLITAPTQVIWGANDEMIDVSAAKMLGELVPCCQRVDILPECGHSVDWDQPGRAANVLVEFRRR